MLKVAIFNFKGGTGKSTTVLNLGACLAATKCRVLLLDLDGQRTLSFGLGQDGQQPTALGGGTLCQARHCFSCFPRQLWEKLTLKT